MPLFLRIVLFTIFLTIGISGVCGGIVGIVVAFSELWDCYPSAILLFFAVAACAVCVFCIGVSSIILGVALLFEFVY